MDDTELVRLLTGLGPAFTATEATDLGVTQHQLQRLTGGLLTREVRGVYTQKRLWATLDPRVRHVALTRAVLASRGDDWFAARRTAAVLHQLPLIGDSPELPVLVRHRDAPLSRGHRTNARVAPVPCADRALAQEVRVTSVARTVVDIAREAPFADAVIAADAALRSGLGADELTAVLDRCRRWPGVAAARTVVAFADGRSESAFESLSRARFCTLGLEIPESQVEIYLRSQLIARVDFLWRAQNVIGEADGRSKYTSVDDFYAEKRREERLRDLGFEVVRWDWKAAYHAQATLDDTLRRSFARGRLNTLHPDVRLRFTRPPVVGRAA